MAHLHLLVNPFRYCKSRAAKIQLVPAVQSLLIQCSAFLIVFTLSYTISLVTTIFYGFELVVPAYIFFLMQALFATLLSQLFGMAIWWRWIHLFFPLAIWVMANLGIPDEIYLFGFIISLSLFWTTFRTQVPYYPSRRFVWMQVAKLMPLNLNKPIRLIDIGSGFGGMSMYIAQHRADSIVEGIEIAPLPWLVSFVRARIIQSTATFKLGDYRHLDFANYDVIFAYLSPVAMQELWEKSHAEMRQGSLLISYEFEIPGKPATYSAPAGQLSPDLYIWVMGSSG